MGLLASAQVEAENKKNKKISLLVLSLEVVFTKKTHTGS